MSSASSRPYAFVPPILAFDDVEPEPAAHGVATTTTEPAAGCSISGASGAVAFDLSHPRATPPDGVAALSPPDPADTRAPGPHAHPWHAQVLAAMARRCGFDRSARVIAWLVAACIGLGLVMVYSTSAIAAERDPRIADALFFLRRQAAAAAIGLVALTVLAYCSLQTWRRLARWSPWLAAAVLVAVLVPGLGHAANGARRWVRIAGLGFQPSDFARVGLMVYLALCAAWHAEGRPRVRWYALAALGGIVGLIAIEPDIGTAATTAGVAVVILWLGGLFHWRHLAIAACVGLPVAAGAAYTAFPHVRKRIAAFAGGADGAGHAATNHQLAQSLVALGAGGPTGGGLGAGRPKLAVLPEESTDFILAEIGEELGFVGTSCVVLLFAALCLHGLAVAWRARTPFGAVLAAGITVLLTSQAAANIGVVTGLLPTTGIPLPFISFGGSGTVALACAAGALIAVARANDRPSLADAVAPWSSAPGTDPRAEDPIAPPTWAETFPRPTVRDERPTDRLSLAEICAPPADPTILAPDLLAELCGAPPEVVGFDLTTDSDPAIELERDCVIREPEFRALEDTRWLERSEDPTVEIEP